MNHCGRCALVTLAVVVVSCRAVSGELPFLSGRVNDQAGILSAETVMELEGTLKAH